MADIRDKFLLSVTNLLRPEYFDRSRTCLHSVPQPFRGGRTGRSLASRSSEARTVPSGGRSNLGRQNVFIRPRSVRSTPDRRVIPRRRPWCPQRTACHVGDQPHPHQRRHGHGDRRSFPGRHPRSRRASHQEPQHPGEHLALHRRQRQVRPQPELHAPDREPGAIRHRGRQHVERRLLSLDAQRRDAHRERHPVLGTRRDRGGGHRPCRDHDGRLGHARELPADRDRRPLRRHHSRAADPKLLGTVRHHPQFVQRRHRGQRDRSVRRERHCRHREPQRDDRQQ